MNVSSGCFVEAALTLRRVAELLDGENPEAEIPDFLLDYSRGCTTAGGLKEAMFLEMAEHFDKGEHWEKAIAVLQELIPYYELVLIDYGKLAQLHRRLSELYAKVNSTLRMESCYFYVAFYGTGFPEYWTNRKFVFRGEKLEKLGDFKARMMNKFYGAQTVDTIKNSDHLIGEEGRFLQIIPVTPIQAESTLDSSAGVLLRWYYKHHDITSFELLRPLRCDDTKWTTLMNTESTQLWIQRRVMTVAHPLPDILNFAPVEFEEEPPANNPVEVAINRIEEVNASLRETAELVAIGFTEYTGPLGGKIIGVLKADVGGGVKSYESFFSDEISALATPEEAVSIKKLRKTLLNHVGIIEFCLYVHAARPQLISEVFHSSCVDLFLDYKRAIETRFGKAFSFLPLGNTIYLPASGNLVAASNNLSASSFTGTTSNTNLGGSNSSISLEDANDAKNNVFMRVSGTLLRSTASKARSSAANVTLQRDKKSSHHDAAGTSVDFDKSRDIAEMAYILRNVIRHTVVESPMDDSTETEGDSSEDIDIEDAEDANGSVSTALEPDDPGLT
uniref:DOCKER domain-containing protein n=1 Tax=Panagrellus redivivus TaxID=6233 RepID=A0A7E4URQ2_PANRE